MIMAHKYVGNVGLAYHIRGFKVEPAALSKENEMVKLLGTLPAMI